MKNRYLLAWCFLTIFISAQAIAQDTLKKHGAVNKAKTAAAIGNRPFAQKLPYGTKPVNTQRPATSSSVAPQKPGVQPAPVKPAFVPPNPADLKGKKLSDQYQYVISKVYHYQQPLIGAFWKNMVDTLNTERKQLKAAQEKLGVLNKSVSTLQADTASKQQTIKASTERADSINFLGISLSKSVYNVTMLGLVGALALALIIVIATTAKHKHEARYRTSLYEELEEEYKNYKAKANEKEKKLARELQTERNKLDELLGRG